MMHRVEVNSPGHIVYVKPNISGSLTPHNMYQGKSNLTFLVSMVLQRNRVLWYSKLIIWPDQNQNILIISYYFEIN